MKIHQLTKKYGDRVALPPLSAEFPAGQTTVIMGASGCGKTTLLRLLLGLEKPDGGKITEAPAVMAAVFQEDRLCEDFSPAENLRMVVGKDPAIGTHLAELGLLSCAHQPVRELSGGMRRRVAIARAMLDPAEAVLLDEPFKGLDDGTRRSVMEYVKRHADGRTLVLVTHEEKEAAFFAEDGNLVRL